MGNHEYCVSCGESDYHSGQPCDPETKRKHDNRYNPCECKKSALTGSRRCPQCGGYQRLKKKDVKNARTRIEWIRQEADAKIQVMKRMHKEELKKAEQECDDEVAAIQACCKHKWGGFAESRICDKCGLTVWE